MKLLAIDESSKSTGLALFEGDRVVWTRRLAPSRDWPWRRRMRWIADGIRESMAEARVTPDVVAIEDAVIHPRNPSAGISVGECRGYLLAHLDSMYGLEMRILSIAPAKVRAAAGISAFARRERSKDRYRLVATHIAGLRADASEDECDAACVGYAAIAHLREQSWGHAGKDRRLVYVGTGSIDPLANPCTSEGTSDAREGQ